MPLSRKGELLYCILFLFWILQCTWWRSRDGYLHFDIGYFMDRCKPELGLSSENYSTVEQNNLLLFACTSHVVYAHFTLYRGMSPSEVECCFKQILNGVAYLHSQGVAHRDIKPENLFFDIKGHLKVCVSGNLFSGVVHVTSYQIGDYGASTVYRLPWEATVHMSTGLCGSEPYIAPEQFLGKRKPVSYYCLFRDSLNFFLLGVPSIHSLLFLLCRFMTFVYKAYDARLVDIWACGIVYYCLHFSEIPWRAAQLSTDPLYQAYASACANSNPEISACPTTVNNLNPRACRPLMRKMLEPNPKLRYKIEDVIDHPWMQAIEICHESPEPKHVHVNATAMAMAYHVA